MEILLAERQWVLPWCRTGHRVGKEDGRSGAKSLYCRSVDTQPPDGPKAKCRWGSVRVFLAAVGEGTVVVRSHGEGPGFFQEINNRGLKIVDATCENVKRAQRAARAMVDAGFALSWWVTGSIRKLRRYWSGRILTEGR